MLLSLWRQPLQPLQLQLLLPLFDVLWLCCWWQGSLRWLLSFPLAVCWDGMQSLQLAYPEGRWVGRRTRPSCR